MCKNPLTIIMARSVRVSVDNFEWMVENIKLRLELVTEVIAWHVLAKALDNLEEHETIFTGELYGSGKVERDEFMKYRVVFDAPHAHRVEYGSEPFRPSFNAIKSWVMGSGKFIFVDEEDANEITAAIVEKISNEGVRAHPFLAPAVFDVLAYWSTKREFPSRLQEVPPEILRRLEGLPER